MRKIVTRSSITSDLTALAGKAVLVWDTETTGLSSFHSAEMFSLAIATLEGDSYYFNFKPYTTISNEEILKPADLKPLFDQERFWIGHNVKFDLHFCAKYGLIPKGRVADTKALARLYENHHHPWVKDGGYSLDACARRWLDQKKDDRVKAWMDENYAFSVVPGKIKKDYHFDLVPFDIISEYAMIDAEVTVKLYQFLRETAYSEGLWDMEIDLTKVLFHVEQRGTLMNDNYLIRAYEYETRAVSYAEAHIGIALPAGIRFVDSAKVLSPLLLERGFEIPQTEKGNDQLNDDVLRQKPDVLAELLLNYREASKRRNTYWHNYLILKDAKDVIHPSFDQAGTVTGRMSCYDPNLQNIPSDDDSAFPVRRAFVARPGFSLVSIDYKAVEFRLALEIAGELELIEKIKNGHDPHQATADLTGLERFQAKTLNFALLYGAGGKKLAGQLGCSLEEALEMKADYFNALPKLADFMDKAKNRLKDRGMVFNVYGRKYHFERFMRDDRMSDNSYKACNLIVQGSAADVMKVALINCHRELNKLQARSGIILTIHDEIVFEIHDDERSLIALMKETMEKAYEYKAMPLECSVEIGPNLHDMEAYV